MNPSPDPQPNMRRFADVSSSNLPTAALTGRSMDVEPADLDNDGDLDLMVANEFGPNILLLNDGSGRFSNASAGRLPRTVHDSEDIGIADFDGDGDLDIIVVSEDDQQNELYLNDGRGFFTDESSRIPVQGTSNAVLVADLDGDGDTDILIGNAGQNVILINDGNANFTDETSARLPQLFDVTQDLELGDVDSDGDLDLLVGNEDDNRLLINLGSGVFKDETQNRLAIEAGLEETREADFGDVDGDGDLDILFANVAFISGKNAQNRLLINNGRGFFADETADRLPAVAEHTADGDFVDIDGDNDLDIVLANAFNGSYRILGNDGAGVFSDQTSVLFPVTISGDGIDVEAVDLDGDQLVDLYLCNFTGADRLLLQVKVDE